MRDQITLKTCRQQQIRYFPAYSDFTQRSVRPLLARFAMLGGLILFSLLQTAQALQAPSVRLQADAQGENLLFVESASMTSGFNLYKNGEYLSTHYSGTISVASDSDGDPSVYCVVAFQHSADGTDYSQCSELLAVNPQVRIQESADAADSDGAAATDGFPSSPPGLRSEIYSVSAIELFWGSASDSGSVSGYEIYRDGVLLDFRDGRSFFDDALQAGTNYRYDVVAVDNDLLRSLPASIAVNTDDSVSSQPVMPSQQPVAEGTASGSDTGDGNAPGPATNLRFEFYSPTVAEIFWDHAPGSDGEVAYELARDDQILALVDGRSYFEPRLQQGTQYRYSLVTIDEAGERSTVANLLLPSAGNPNQNTPDNPVDVPSGATSDEPSDVPGDPQFTLRLPDNRYSLQEGDESHVLIPVSLLRTNGHSRQVQLTVESVSDQSGSVSEASIDTNNLGGNAGETVFNVRLRLPVGRQPLSYHERRFRLFADDGLRVSTAEVVVDVVPVRAPDVYLLVGQSNMVGFSNEGQKQAGAGGVDEPVERIRQLNVTSNNTDHYAYDGAFQDPAAIAGSPRLIKAEDPLHELRYPGFSNKPGTHIGPGLSFAKATLASTTQEIVLVPAAWSGTGFCGNGLGPLAWNARSVDQPWLGGTGLADRALARLNLALQESGGVFRGILWHQGESDSNNPDCAYSYGDNLRSLVQRFRSEAREDIRGAAARGADADIPFVLATMSRGNDSRGNFSHFGGVKDHVDGVHRGIAGALPHADFVNTDDLVPPAYPCGNGSCIHFGAEAYRELGRRYFSALQRVWNR